jgi:hypothetical protein
MHGAWRAHVWKLWVSGGYTAVHAPLAAVVGGNNYASVYLLSNPAQCLIKGTHSYTALIPQSESVIDVAFSLQPTLLMCCSLVGGLASCWCLITFLQHLNFPID